MLAPARLHRPSPAHPAAPAPRAAAPVPRPAPTVAADAAHSFARVSVHPAPVSLQAKLKVGGAGDPHEREAEQVADRVMREAAPAPHRCSCGGTCPTCRAAAARRKELARAAEGGAVAPATAPPVVHEVLRSPGRPLDAAAAAFLEPRFGHDFGRVRVHADGLAAESARAVGARAYTVGRDVVFGAGEYRPETEGGRRLLAHELAHVLQQDASPSVLRRAPDPAPATGTARAPVSSKGPSTLKVTRKENACACLVFVHNEERNARLTAGLMHQHCSYNLAMIDPDSPGRREVPVKGAGTLDPNSFFDPKVIAACRADPQGCDAFEKKNKANPTLDWTRKQFFMAIHACSDAFKLPVVALHNNSIEDTRALQNKLKKDEEVRAATAKDGEVAPDPFEGVPRDLEKPVMEKPGKKPAKKKPADPAVEAMEKALRDRFGKKIQKELTAKPGTTNIFRWCAASELSRCHIGAPERPDVVVWVTNEADFKKLSGEKVNVALQTGVGKESVGDLSSMFLELADLIRGDAAARARQITGKLDFRTFLQPEFWERIKEGMDIMDAAEAEVGTLHYVNVETPAKALDKNAPADQHAVEQYEAIVATLKPLGLHCCGKNETAEDDIKAAITARLAPPPKEEKKKPAARKK